MDKCGTDVDLSPAKIGTVTVSMTKMLVSSTVTVSMREATHCQPSMQSDAKEDVENNSTGRNWNTNGHEE